MRESQNSQDIKSIGLVCKVPYNEWETSGKDVMWFGSSPMGKSERDYQVLVTQVPKKFKDN